MRIFAPQGLQAIGSQVIGGSVEIGSGTDLGNIARLASNPSSVLNSFVSSHLGSLDLSAVPAALRGQVDHALSGITSSLTSRINGMTSLNGVAGIESRIQAEVTEHFGSLERVINQHAGSSDLASTLVTSLRSQFTSLAPSLASTVSRSMGSSDLLAVAGHSTNVSSLFNSAFSSASGVLSGGGLLSSLNSMSSHKIHLGEGAIGLGLGTAQRIVMGGGTLSIGSALGHINLGGGLMHLASAAGNLSMGGGLFNLGNVAMTIAGINVGAVSIGVGGISIGGVSIGSGGISIGGHSVPVSGGGGSNSVENLSSNNASYLGGHPASYYTKRVIEVLVSDPASDITAGTGKAYFRISSTINGYDLVEAAAQVTSNSSSGVVSCNVYNVTSSAQMFSTPLTIDANERDSSTAATPVVIDSAHKTVATGDQIRIDVGAAGTGAKGLIVELTFSSST